MTHCSGKIGIVAAALWLTQLSAFVAEAKSPKPPGGGTTATGVLYYTIWSDELTTYVTRRINADGSNAVDVYYGADLGEPTHELHAGRRYFLSMLSSSLDAVAENGTRVVLVDEPDFEFLNGAHWVRNTADGWISCEGRRWTTDPDTHQPVAYDEGIYVAQVDFDRDTGAVLGTIPGSFQLIVPTSDVLGYPNGHDWGTDGRLLFSVSDGAGSTALWIADFSEAAAQRYTAVDTGSTRRIGSPVWSPEGSLVAFDEVDTGIVILALATASRQTISASGTYVNYGPFWSPAGDHLAFHRGSLRTYETDIYLATPDGRNRTWLTAGVCLGWRD